MSKQVSASNAKNNFGGLLDDVAALGRVEIVKHGRLVAIVLSPRALRAALTERADALDATWGEPHMISPDRARSAQVLGTPSDFDVAEVAKRRAAGKKLMVPARRKANRAGGTSLKRVYRGR